MYLQCEAKVVINWIVMNLSKRLAMLVIWFPCVALVTNPVAADQSGPFTYEVLEAATVTITDYSGEASGHVEIPAEIAGLPVTRIRSKAFEQVPGMVSVTIPASVAQIGMKAFISSTLSIVHMLGDAPELEGVAFGGARAFKIYYPVDAEGFANPTWQGYVASPGGREGMFTYQINGDFVGIVRYPQDAEGRAIIPPKIEGRPVTSVNQGAFSGCRGLTGVSIPGGVTAIGASAFSGCVALTHVVIPDSVTTLGSSSFRGCELLETIVLSSELTEIGREAFYQCGKLYGIELSPGVTTIGELAFRHCDSLLDVGIPTSTTTIGDRAFASCAALQSITVAEGNTHFSSMDGVLFDFEQTRLLQYPAGKIGEYEVSEGVDEIARSAFMGCSRLTRVTLPEGLEGIGEYGFHGCSALEEITLPKSLVSLGSGTFIHCFGLREITVRASVSAIDSNVFRYCRGLRSLKIDEGVTRVGSHAFLGCESLGSVTIPASVSYIEYGAFVDCGSLRGALFSGNAPGLSNDDVFRDSSADFTVYYFKGASGFTSPTWKGYPSIEIDPSSHPGAAWLISAGLPHDIDLNQDLNGDGVSLLLAYALNLIPSDHLAGQLPQPILTGEELGISFHAIRPGIIYSVECSDDLHRWSSNGVTMSEPDALGRRTATADRTERSRFLRLVVELEPSF